MQADYHMHTSFSADVDRNNTPNKMIEAAIQKGLKTICITDHHDVDGEGEDFLLNFEEYCSALETLREEYRDIIDIRIGVEFGLQPHLGKVYKGIAKKYPFDFIIGSVHVIDGMDPYYKKYFEGRSDEEAYRRAFEVTLEDVKRISDFDVLGHMDYVVRYGLEQEKSYSYKKYEDIIDEILKVLIECGKGIEFNTAGFKYGLSFGHPHADILKRYRELGGEIITIGADAHRPEYVAYNFDKVSDILKSCGFKNYTEFVERKPIFRQLP